ncbi:MAG TPA: hypothetical protein VF148_03550 [Acidimicrobiia bacterium]
MSANLRAWLLSVGFFLAGVGLLWWAYEQWLNMAAVMGQELQVPSARLLLWMLTLIVSGFSFGMTTSSARSSRERARPAILLSLAFIPFAALYYFWTQVTLGWFPALPTSAAEFLYDDRTLLASSLILGLFLSGLVGSVEVVHEPVVEPVIGSESDFGEGEDSNE